MMQQSKLLQAAELTVQIFQSLVKHLETDPPKAQELLLQLAQAVNVLSTEVAKAKDTLTDLETFKLKLSQLDTSLPSTNAAPSGQTLMDLLNPQSSKGPQPAQQKMVNDILKTVAGLAKKNNQGNPLGTKKPGSEK